MPAKKNRPEVLNIKITPDAVKQLDAIVEHENRTGIGKCNKTDVVNYLIGKEFESRELSLGDAAASFYNMGLANAVRK